MSTRRKLDEDQRGHLMIPGLLGASLMIGGIVQIFNFGKAVLYRESVQGAADIAAAEAARWHANGMNLLALVNILMALVLSVLVAIRLAELLAVAGVIFFTVTAWLTGGATAGLAAQCGRVASEMLKLERRVSPRIMEGLQIGTEVERWVSVATPYVATTISIVPSLADDIEGVGIAGSLSLTPTMVDDLASRGPNLFPARMGTHLGAINGQSGSANRIVASVSARLPGSVRNVGNAITRANGWIGSLPVEEEPFAGLCSRAAENIVNYSILSLIPRADSVAAWIGGNLPGLACQPVGEALDSLAEKLEDELKDSARNECRQEEEAAVAAETERLQRNFRGDDSCRLVQTVRRIWHCATGRQPPVAPPWSASRRRSCRESKEEEKREASNRQIEQARQAERERQANSENIKTAKLWNLVSEPDGMRKAKSSGGQVRASNAFLETWSVHFAPDVDITPVYIRNIPFLRNLPVQIPDVLPGLAFEANRSSAKADFYHECQGGTTIHNCADDALWQIRWRYRLGVNRSFFAELQITGSDMLRGWVAHLSTEAATAISGRVSGFLGDRLRLPGRARQGASGRDQGTQEATNLASEWVERFLGRERRAGANGRHAYDWWLGDKTSDGVGALLPDSVEIPAYLR